MHPLDIESLRETHPDFGIVVSALEFWAYDDDGRRELILQRAFRGDRLDEDPDFPARVSAQYEDLVRRHGWKRVAVAATRPIHFTSLAQRDAWLRQLLDDLPKANFGPIID